MKNLFKFGFLALALSLGVAACNSEKKDGANDTTVVDSTTVVDTNVVDTVTGDTSKVGDTTIKH